MGQAWTGSLEIPEMSDVNSDKGQEEIKPDGLQGNLWWKGCKNWLTEKEGGRLSKNIGIKWEKKISRKTELNPYQNQVGKIFSFIIFISYYTVWNY